MQRRPPLEFWLHVAHTASKAALAATHYSSPSGIRGERDRRSLHCKGAQITGSTSGDWAAVNAAHQASSVSSFFPSSSAFASSCGSTPSARRVLALKGAPLLCGTLCPMKGSVLYLKKYNAIWSSEFNGRQYFANSRMIYRCGSGHRSLNSTRSSWNSFENIFEGSWSTFGLLQHIFNEA